ncbi:MAG: Tim44/TimA family putative adaptor protein [Alphaproteobacteria bacterium]
MSGEVFQVVVLAAIAAVALYALYAALGRRTGAEPPAPAPQAKPALSPADPGNRAEPAPVQPAPSFGGGGVADIARADPSFDVSSFLAGARSAYELIVQAFSTGDRAALRPLLTTRVFSSYDKAITEREAAGGKGPELVRLKNVEIADADLDGQIARVAVRFEAELAEGAHGIRDTRERWTFERDVTSQDPNWRSRQCRPSLAVDKMRRPLTPAETALWRRVARHARPLPGKTLPPEPEAPLEPAANKAKVAAPKPVMPQKARKASPPADRGGERRVQRGQLEIAARLDLHGYTQDGARAALSAFITSQAATGARVVLVITGKSGVLRQRLPGWLELPDFRARLAGFAQAHRTHGGDGAWYVFLRKS